LIANILVMSKQVDNLFWTETEVILLHILMIIFNAHKYPLAQLATLSKITQYIE